MLKGKRYTTVNTDAGFKEGIAVYGYWIRSNNVRKIGSNRFKTPKTDPNDAELAAILTALLVVINDPYLASADQVVVNSDSKNAIRALSKNMIEEDSVYYEEWQNIRSKLKKIHFKWVKGHSKGNTAREWVNNFIDKDIRKHY